MANHGNGNAVVRILGMPLMETKRWAVAMVVSCALIFLGLPCPSNAEPLDAPVFGSVGFEAYISKIAGRIGIDNEVVGVGTLNSFANDLGLPEDNQTYRVLMQIRPLEHHNLRAYGHIPEDYKGEKVITRTLITRVNVYAPGTLVQSELQHSMVGVGYDLDFLVGPRWYAGLTGDLRYIHLRVKFGTSEAQQEDMITLDELTPCLGAHAQTRFPLGTNSNGVPLLNVGLFGRMTYAVTPNFLNYFDVQMGLNIGLRPMGMVMVDAKAGWEHESYLHELQVNSGRHIEYKRDGIFGTLEVAF